MAAVPLEVSSDVGEPPDPEHVLSQCLVGHFDRIRFLVAARMGAQNSQWVNADDIAHDVIVESLQHAEGFHYDGEPRFIQWISTVTQRVVADAIRRGRREPRALSIQNSPPAEDVVRPSRVPGSTETPSKVASGEEHCRLVLAALAALRESDRTVIRMVQLEERTLDDVGAALGCSKRAAVMRFSRALDRLSNEYEKWKDGANC